MKRSAIWTFVTDDEWLPLVASYINAGTGEVISGWRKR